MKLRFATLEEVLSGYPVFDADDTSYTFVLDIKQRKELRKPSILVLDSEANCFYLDRSWFKNNQANTDFVNLYVKPVGEIQGTPAYRGDLVYYIPTIDRVRIHSINGSIVSYMPKHTGNTPIFLKGELKDFSFDVPDGYMLVNGEKVKKPILKCPEDRTKLYVSSPGHPEWYYSITTKHPENLEKLILRNLVHLTVQDAVNYAIALSRTI